MVDILKTFDYFTVGFKGSFTKTVTEQDNVLFADISGDYNPIHFKDNVANSIGFKGAISNGFVTESRIAGALVNTFGSDTTLVVALEKNTRFLNPVYMEDEITATVEVVEQIKSMQVLRIKAACYNQHNQRVVATNMLIKIVTLPLA
ncbi:MAG TPA: MaoC/PaaZ C-terminal domain-containing protein [Coxiellaceae bacterium]|nr:MaoC/PaaZ C-terminal domain-containing protein [Coxiellaceae bacterium]